MKKFVIDNPEPFIVQVDHTGSDWHYCKSMNEPLPVITSKHGFGIVSPLLIQYHSETTENGVRGQELQDPIMTVDGSNRYGLVTSFLSKFYKTGIGQDLREPLHTVTTSAGHFGEVRAFLIKYYGQGTGQKIEEPLDTVTSNDRFGLVTIQGADYQIVDIGLRMLEPRELYNAQGFPKDYIIDKDDKGQSYSRTEQVKRCGNAVPPPFAEALVKSNLPELCTGKRMPNMAIDDSEQQLKFA
jgi:DNA (cytosine-5)-methyltransferase 1